MITYNSENALIFNVPYQYGCTLPSLKDVQSYSFGGYGTGISAFGVQQGAQGSQSPGIFIKTAPDTWGILLGDEFQPQIYRGQNQDFPSFKSSYDRLDGEENKILALSQREEFRKVFVQTPYYTRCRNFSVYDCKYEFDFEAIFQHYGFKSSYIDITKELMVALFFAYTYTENGSYYPVHDFTKYNPTLYISYISEIQKNANVHPISLQMVKRPVTQMAMAINTNENDLKVYFEKYELPKNPMIAIDIYEKFRHGEALFPREPISDIANQILVTKELNEDVVKKVCHENSVCFEDVKREFESRDYVFSNIEWQINEDMRLWMNSDIDEKWLPFLEQISRRRCSPIANMNKGI